MVGIGTASRHLHVRSRTPRTSLFSTPFLSLLAAVLGASLHASVALAQSASMLSVLGPSRVTAAGRVEVQPAAAAAADASSRYAPYESGVETYLVPRRGGRGKRKGGSGGAVVTQSVGAAAPGPSLSSSSASSPSSSLSSCSPSSSSPSSSSATAALSPTPSVVFLPPAALDSRGSSSSSSSSSRKLLQNTRLETSLRLASDLVGPVSPPAGSTLGWTGAAVPRLRSEGKLRSLGVHGGCTACVVGIEDAGPLRVQTRDLNDGVATLSNLQSVYQTFFLTALERRFG